MELRLTGSRAAYGTANEPRPTQAAEVAQSAAALAASVTPITGRTLSCECTTCKKGFNTPAKSVSGYSVIGKSAAFFILGMILLAMSWVSYSSGLFPLKSKVRRSNMSRPCASTYS